MNKSQISRSFFMDPCMKPFLRKRLLNICVLSLWNFTDIDFLVEKKNFPAAAVLRYNGNFSRDFYGSDFASSPSRLLVFFGSYISHELNKSERNKSSAQICKTVFITFWADIYTSECFLLLIIRVFMNPTFPRWLSDFNEPHYCKWKIHIRRGDGTNHPSWAK